MQMNFIGPKPLYLHVQINFWDFKLAQTIIFAYANESGGSETISFACSNRLVDLQICPNHYICLRKTTFGGVELLKTIIFACANGTDGPQTIVFACPNVHSFSESH